MRRADQVDIRLLGRFAVVRGGVELPTAAFAGRKVRTLVKVLASRQGSYVSNDALAEALWPARLPSNPVANLQVLVNRARHALGDPALIVTGQGGYSLGTSSGCRVDAQAFLAALGDRPLIAARLHEALSLWQGDPLPEEAYDDWAVEFRAQLFRAHQDALEQAAPLALAEGDVSTAVDLASRAVQAEPLREIAVSGLVEALVAAGDGAGALLALEDHRRALADQLGVDPSPALRELHQRLLEQPPPRPSPTRRRGRPFTELPFVGRDTELLAIRRALAPSGTNGVIVTVGGPSGSGKSRLLDVLGRDVPLIRARAYLPERSEPWTLLRTLLREVTAQDVGYVEVLPDPMAQALAWLLPELGRPGGPEPDPESRRLLVNEAALRLLGASDAVVAIDDLQWCDPSSLSVLEAATARLPGLRTVLAFRPEELVENAEVRDYLTRTDPALRVDVAALAEETLREVVADLSVVQAVARHTDRTPMAITEVVRALALEGLVVSTADGPWLSTGPGAGPRAAVLAQEGQRRAIGARVAAQPAEDRELLALLALLAREASVPTMASASGTDEPPVLDALGRLFRRGLVRQGDHGWATSHDMVTEVVVEGLDAVERARLHASLARALHSAGDPVVLARHLREAGDLERAADSFALAAQRALDAFAADEAAALAETGLELAPPDPAKARLLEIRGQARHRVGLLAGARDDLRAALALQPPGPPRARVLARLAMLSAGADDIERAAALAELALVEAGADPATHARALEVASVLDMNLEREDRAAHRASRALALYEGLGDANGMARVLDARAMAQFLGGDVGGGEAALRRAADLFEDSGDLVRVMTPRSTAGHALVFAGQPAPGLARVDEALGLARTLGHPEGLAYALWHRAEALVALGRGEEAVAEAAEALITATRIGHRGLTATAWRATGLAAHQLGDLDAALRAFRTSLEISEHLGLFACWAAARAAMVLVLTGAPEQALPLARRALAQGPALGHYEARWARVEVAEALGDPSAPVLAQEALSLMEAGGVVQGRDRLRRVAERSA